MGKQAKKYRPTTRKMVEAKLRKAIWLVSRERAEAKRRDKNTCQRCGAKGSKAKGREVPDPEVHHKSPVDFAPIVDLILDSLLCHPDNLECLCSSCHRKEHGRSNED